MTDCGQDLDVLRSRSNGLDGSLELREHRRADVDGLGLKAQVDRPLARALDFNGEAGVLSQWAGYKDSLAG